MATKSSATIPDLYLVDGKAEIVNGEIQLLSPTGGLPGRAGGAIYISLRQYEGTIPGRAHPDNIGFRVHLAHRESFSPDAAFHSAEQLGMEFIEGAPLFAAEVRSASDYGPQAELDIAAKRLDYFAAGSQVVWDVDLLHDEVVRSYSAANPHQPTIFRRGEVAHAEPALPSWPLAVNELFR